MDTLKGLSQQNTALYVTLPTECNSNAVCGAGDLDGSECNLLVNVLHLWKRSAAGAAAHAMSSPGVLG